MSNLSRAFPGRIEIPDYKLILYDYRFLLWDDNREDWNNCSRNLYFDLKDEEEEEIFVKLIFK